MVMNLLLQHIHETSLKMVILFRSEYYNTMKNNDCQMIVMFLKLLY